MSWRNKALQPVTVHRWNKHEAEQAVKELLDRGYELIYPLTEQRQEGKVFYSDNRKRQIFEQNTVSGCWVAKLRKIQ